MRKAGFALLLALFLVSCGKLNEVTAPGNGGGGPVDPTATFTRVQTEIFTPTCAIIACHGQIAPQENLTLTPSQSYANVSRPSVQMSQLLRVKPGDPANSYLYRKITGVGITGDRMPQAGPPLTAAQLSLIRDWIRRGAPND